MKILFLSIAIVSLFIFTIFNNYTNVEIIESNIIKINPYGNIKYNVYPNKHWPDFWNRVNHRIWEPELFQTIAKYVNKNVTFIDFGTWIGPTLLFGCKISKKCYGLEPDPEAFKEVSKNIKLNNNLNVELLQNCVSTKNGPITMYSKSPGNSESSVFKNTFNWTVQCYTMEHLYDFWNIKGKVFMKIDIEGAEYILLNHWFKWLENLPIKPMLYISLHGNSDDIMIKRLYRTIERRENILFLIK